MIDFNSCPLSMRHGNYGGQAGMKDGIIYDDDYWIVKYPRSTRGLRGAEVSYTTSPLSEYVGSHIYDILGYDVHETALGERNGKIVVACRDFRKDDQLLVEISSVKNAVNQKLAERLDREFSSTGSDHIVNLEELVIHLDENDILKNIPGIRERFWDCAIIDALIYNNDRNNGNWAILRRPGEDDQLAPIYDNGGSFSNKMSLERMEKNLSDERRLLASSVDTMTIYSLGGKALSVKKLFSLEHTDFIRAALRVAPVVAEHMDDIYNFIYSLPDEYRGAEVCCDTRKDYMWRTFELRADCLLFPVYEKLRSEIENSVPEL